MAEQCWKCGTPLQVGAGIGAYCPNPACDVVDAPEPVHAWEVRIDLGPPARPAGRVPVLAEEETEFVASV